MPGHHAFSMHFMSLSLPSTRQLLEWKSANVQGCNVIVDCPSLVIHLLLHSRDWEAWLPRMLYSTVTSSFIFVSFHPTPNFLLVAFVAEGGNSILIVKKDGLFHVSLLPLLTGILFMFCFEASASRNDIYSTQKSNNYLIIITVLIDVLLDVHRSNCGCESLP